MKKYIVRMIMAERAELERLASTGVQAARKIQRARILLNADQGEDGPYRTDKEIAEFLGCGTATVERVRKSFVENGVDASLTYEMRSDAGIPRKLDGEVEAHLIATACSAAPGGRAKWTLKLLSERFVELRIVASVSRESIRRVLKKTNLYQSQKLDRHELN